MGAIRHLAAAAVLVLAIVSGTHCFAEAGGESRLASSGTERGAHSSPAVSLDRRVPAAQVTDREGLSLIGVLGVVGELRHAFSRKEVEQPGGNGVTRMFRTLRDSVFGKRISILSESGRMVENDPCLVGFSFTH
jgi:hypothetical protein